MLTDNEINRLCDLLKHSAQAKKKLAKTLPPADRDDVTASAMRDYELRKKLISMKRGVQ